MVWTSASDCLCGQHSGFWSWERRDFKRAESESCQREWAKQPDELGSHVLPHAHDEKQKLAPIRTTTRKPLPLLFDRLLKRSGHTLELGTILLSSLHDQTAKTCFRYYRTQMLQISVTASKHEK